MLEIVFPTIEWKGIRNRQQMISLFNHIYNSTHAELIEKHVGYGLHDIRVFTEGLIHSTEESPDFYTHLDCLGKEWDTEYNKFLYKISQVYLRPEVQFLLENNTIDHSILDLLYNFIKTKGQILTVGPIGEEVKQKSIIKAFCEVGLLYPEKHMSYLNTRYVYAKFFKKYYTEKLRKMTFIEKFDYNWWALWKGLHVKDMDQNRERTTASLYTDEKENQNWDLDLYSEVGRRDDPSKEGLHYMDKESGKLMFFTYGKFTELPPIKYLLLPVIGFLTKIVNFPHAWMHLPRKHEMEGNPEPALTSNVYKWLENRRDVESSLPQYGAEVKLGLHKDEGERALLKVAYIYDKPEMFRKPIKWRYIRRYAREVYKGKTNKPE